MISCDGKNASIFLTDLKGQASVQKYSSRFGLTKKAVYCDYVCLISCNADKTRLQNVTWIVVDGPAVQFKVINSKSQPTLSK